MQLVTWFVMFPGTAGPLPFWRRCLRAGYRHVLAVRDDGPNRCMLIEHSGAALESHSLPQPAATLVRDMQAHLVAWVLLVLLPVPSGPPRLRPPMTCVEAVKAALGMYAWHVLTPHQLARHLRRRHGALTVLPTPNRN